MKSFSCVRLFATPWTVGVYHAPLSMGFSRQEYGVGCHFLLQRIFLTQGLNPGLPHCRQTLYHLSGHGNGNLIQYSCLGNPIDRGAWWATDHGISRVGHNWVCTHAHHIFISLNPFSFTVYFSFFFFSWKNFLFPFYLNVNCKIKSPSQLIDYSSETCDRSRNQLLIILIVREWFMERIK